MNNKKHSTYKMKSVLIIKNDIEILENFKKNTDTKYDN